MRNIYIYQEPMGNEDRLFYLKANVTKRKTTSSVNIFRHNKVPSQTINILQAQQSATLIRNITHTVHKYNNFSTGNSTSLPLDAHYSSPSFFLIITTKSETFCGSSRDLDTLSFSKHLLQ